MRAAPFANLLLGFTLAASAAHAQDRPDLETLRSSLTEMLSLFSFGAVSAPAQSAQVTQSGSDYRIQVPLSGFATPAGAAVEAIARPADNGVWDVTSMTLPPAGTIATEGGQHIAYTIGEQAIHGSLDPGLATPSTYAAALRAITLQADHQDQHAEQTIERMTMSGALSAAADGRVDLRAGGAATNWHLVAHDGKGMSSDSLVRRVDGHFSLLGLDRAQGARLMAAARSLMESANPPGQPPALSPAARDGLRDMVDATAGLLARIEADETLEGVKFDLGGANSGAIGRMHLHMTGRAEDQRLDAGIDIAMDEFVLAAVPPDAVAYVPHHVDIKPILAGIPTGPLIALLRAATAPGADTAALQDQAAALLDSPDARMGIESVVFDSGPVHVRGSARVVLRANGQPGADIHLSASGMDGLIAQAQGKPALQNVLPMVFIAKGMGRQQGDSVVWDISLGGGPITVNGVPFGQPAARRR